MEIKKKTVYIARDDTEFNLQEDCILHEELLNIADVIERQSIYHKGGLQASSYELAIVIRQIMEEVAGAKKED